MIYQRSASRHRVLPPSLRSCAYATPLRGRYAHKVQWGVWIAVTMLSLVLLGVILTAHCQDISKRRTGGRSAA